MKAPFLISSRFRPTSLLRLVRRAKGLPLGGKIVDWFDPNIIAKHLDYRFPRRLTLFTADRFKLWLDLNDHIGFRTFIRKEPFENNVYLLAKAIGVGRDDIILDIGANIGTASIPICAETGCELIAVEASKANAALLLQNAALNDIRIQPHIVALTAPGDAGQYVPLYLREGNRGANSLFDNWSPSAAEHDVETVRTRTLDSILSDDATIDRIRIVKIDIEGAEWGMVRGAERFFARNTAPVLMEYRSDAMGGKDNADFRRLLDHMLEQYDVCGLDTQGQRVAFDVNGSYENIMFTRKALIATAIPSAEDGN